MTARQDDATHEYGMVRDRVDIGNALLENMGTLQSQLRILDSLRQTREGISGKHVPEAWHGTFEWMLDPNTAGFYQWLTSMGGLFWAAGKPGSGKTTLMKFLYCHPSTKRALQQWAVGSACVVVDHFFGAAGSEIQQSLDGILVSLLERVIVEVPQLTPIIFPHRWEKPLLQSRSWSRSELLECVRTLASQTSIPTKICLFVDALDEFVGDLNELFCLLDLLGESPSIKLCVSSREWLCFKQFFHARHATQKRSLYLQHYTEEDIKHYVQQRLQCPGYSGSTTRGVGCVNENPSNCFVDGVISKANGVFLWVRLVCDQLVRGIENQDSNSMLQSRLDALPLTLENYFLQTLERLDPIYRRECARILLMMVAAKRPLELLGFQFLEGLDQIPAELLEEKAIFPDDPSQLKVQSVLRTRLQAYAVDMIDILPLDPRRPNRLHVVFSHSTFETFLSTSKVQELLRHNAVEGWSPNRCLCESLLLHMKQLPPLKDATSFDPRLKNKSLRDIFLSYLQSFAYHMGLLEAELGDTDEDLMEFLDEIFLNQSSEAYHTWPCCLEDPLCNRSLQGRYRRGSVVAFAAQYNLLYFVRRQLDRDPSLIKGRGLMYPLLRYALCPVLSCRTGRVLSTSMVNLLLERGASPMQRYLGMTTYTEFAGALTKPTAPMLLHWNQESSNLEKRELVAVIRSLLQAGAFVSTHLELRTSPHGGFQVQLVNSLAVTKLQIRAPGKMSLAQLDCLVLKLPTQALWRSGLDVLHSIRIIVWIAYTLGMRFIRDAIRPHRILDILTILICLAPNAILVMFVAGREEWLGWFGVSFRVAYLTAALRCMTYHTWEKKRISGEIRPPWELFEVVLLPLVRRMMVRQVLLIQDQNDAGGAPRRWVQRHKQVDSLSGTSDSVWDALVSFLRDAFGKCFTFRKWSIAAICVCLVLMGAGFAATLPTEYSVGRRDCFG